MKWINKMETRDKFEELAAVAACAVVVLGNGREFELIDLDTERDEIKEQKGRLSGSGFEFVGVIGLVDGRPKSALAVPLDHVTTAALSQAFVRPVEDALNASAEVAWLKRLYALRDDRREVN